MTYAAVTPAIVAELRAIVGEKSVWVDEERLETYAHDETSAEEYAHAPEAVVLPTTTEHVAAIVRLANHHHIPITPRGAGSGLSGGAIPVFGGILISLERMDKLIDLDLDNMTITAEAGMVTNDLAHTVAEHGLFFAGYPMSVETCQIGGNIAENAGGGKAVKYGVTGRYVLGLELVTPTGDVVWLGGKLAKDVSGYDLKQLVIGSEGTLGIVTQAIIKLTAYPKAASDLLVLFESPRAAIDLVPRMLRQGIVPTGIEFMDRLSFQTSCEYLNETLPSENAGAMLLIEVDGNDPAAVEADLLAIGDLCEKHGAIEVYVAEDRNAVERVWAVRRNIAEAFKVASPVQSLEDIVVPVASIPDVIPELERLAATYGMQIPCYGHAGDGNLHATLVKDPAMDDATWLRNKDACLRELYRFVQGLGGKISGEHGIGLKRKKYLPDVTNPVEIDLMRAIKRAWDPNLIMNPGKVFDLAASRST
ncbi:MAG: FAD-linked oxidase C-terminal domain-containing protein [Trueperaceae bacterium]